MEEQKTNRIPYSKRLRELEHPDIECREGPWFEPMWDHKRANLLLGFALFYFFLFA